MPHTLPRTFLKLTALSAMVAATAFVVVPANAQDPIAERQQAMKSVGGAMRVVGGMARGTTDFDAMAALEAFQTMNEVAGRYASLFPEGSETGGDTEAKETIWTDRAGFEAEVAKFETATAAAIAAAPQDLDSFRAVFGPVGQSCGSCHEGYRIDK